MKKIDLSFTNLIGANLIGANLSGTNLSGANLSGANLSGAYLFRPYFIGANFRRANLIGAGLSGLNFSGANLFHNYFVVANLTLKQIKLTCNWDKAIYKAKYDKKKRTWVTIEPDNQNYIEELKKDTSSDPEEPPNCTVWN